MIRKGRFDKPAAEFAQRYGELCHSIGVLYRHDTVASIAHTQRSRGDQSSRPLNAAKLRTDCAVEKEAVGKVKVT
jgi:hypothetical protein